MSQYSRDIPDSNRLGLPSRRRHSRSGSSTGSSGLSTISDRSITPSESNSNVTRSSEREGKSRTPSTVSKTESVRPDARNGMVMYKAKRDRDQYEDTRSSRGGAPSVASRGSQPARSSISTSTRSRYDDSPRDRDVHSDGRYADSRNLPMPTPRVDITPASDTGSVRSYAPSSSEYGVPRSSTSSASGRSRAESSTSSRSRDSRSHDSRSHDSRSHDLRSLAPSDTHSRASSSATQSLALRPAPHSDVSHKSTSRSSVPSRTPRRSGGGTIISTSVSAPGVQITNEVVNVRRRG
jgi:hypothetical protein